MAYGLLEISAFELKKSRGEVRLATKEPIEPLTDPSQFAPSERSNLEY